MDKSHKRIGEILIEKGWITEAQLHDALSEQRLSDQFLGAILVGKGWINDHTLMEALSLQFGLPLIDLSQEYIDMELARKFSSSLVIDHKCIPISENEEMVTVAILNPLNAVAISKIEEEARPKRVNFVLAQEKHLDQAILQYKQYVSQSIQRLLKKKRTDSS